MQTKSQDCPSKSGTVADYDPIVIIYSPVILIIISITVVIINTKITSWSSSINKLYRFIQVYNYQLMI